jgi:pyruvate dehydrogenase E2 component (dihydrolipoamide acetyltransferase)
VPQDVKLPELAESVVEGEVLKWLVAVGDTVVVDQPIVEVMTDKVTVELPSPLAGVLAEIVAPEGAVVAVGAVLARIDMGGGVAGAAPPRATPTAGGGERAASPLDGEGDDADAADGVAQGDEFSLFKASADDDDAALPTLRRRAVGASRLRAVLQESSACRSSRCSVPVPPGGCGSTTSIARQRTWRRPLADCPRRCAP